jgi:hypothetical protein
MDALPVSDAGGSRTKATVSTEEVLATGNRVSREHHTSALSFVFNCHRLFAFAIAQVIKL